jgi:hypothetical protein
LKPKVTAVPSVSDDPKQDLNIPAMKHVEEPQDTTPTVTVSDESKTLSGIDAVHSCTGDDLWGLNELSVTGVTPVPRITYLRLSKSQGRRPVKWFARSATPTLRVKALNRLEFWKELKAPIQQRISTYTKYELQRRLDTWYAIEDCFMMSTPEMFETSKVSSMIPIFRWVWSLLGQSNGVSYMTKVWKGWEVLKTKNT